MTEDIQQAESAIKAGDTKTGFEILRRVLADNPESERAWWIMSGLVQRDQRAFCLEQVLRINPANRLAWDTLEKLHASPPEPETKPPRQVPHPPQASSLAQESLQSFLYSRGSSNYLTILDGKRLIRAQVDTDHLVAADRDLKEGRVPEGYLSNMKTVPLNAIQSVLHNGSALLVSYQDGGIERSLRLAFESQTKAKVLLGVLNKKLGPNYLIRKAPPKLGLSLAISILLTVISVGFSGWVLWNVQQVSINPGLEGEGTRLAASLLNALGSFGVVLLCAAAILAALGLSALLLLRPPVRAELTRRP